MWDFAVSPTFKNCCCFPLFQNYRCYVILSYIITFNMDIVNWEFVDAYNQYLNKAWLLAGFKVGVSNSSVYRLNLNSWPTAAPLLITLVSSIGALFHAYWDVFCFGSIHHDYFIYWIIERYHWLLFWFLRLDFYIQ